MKKELTCIVCPMGCHVSVELKGSTIISVIGNTCPRGAEYARKEVTTPMRMVTTTVRIHHANLPLLPVITSQDVPKERIFDIMENVRQIEVYAPIKCGTVIARNIANTCADLVASKTMDEVDQDESMCTAGLAGLETV